MSRHHFYRLGATTRQDGLIETVFDCLPKKLCRSAVVTANGKPIDERIVQSVMQAIRLGWTAARKVGVASIVYEEETLKVRYGGIVRNGRRLAELPAIPGYSLFGYQEYPQHNYGETIATVELFEAVCAYRQVMQYLAGRIENSYSEMLITAGELAVDMADEVRAKIDREYRKKRRIQAPEGSNLIGNQVSLTDINSAMQPFRERIAHEAGIPIWMIFPDTVGTKYELENRADYLQTEFDSYVKPAVVGVFDLMGYSVSVETPTFRDLFFAAEVYDKTQDGTYKKSAANQNDSAVVLSKKQFQLELAQMRQDKPEAKTATVPQAPKTRKGNRR